MFTLTCPEKIEIKKLSILVKLKPTIIQPKTEVLPDKFSHLANG